MLNTETTALLVSAYAKLQIFGKYQHGELHKVLMRALDENIASMQLKDLTIASWGLGVSVNTDKSIWESIEKRFIELINQC